MPPLITWRVVSSPPTRISSDSCSTSSGASRSPSTSACTSTLMRSSVGVLLPLRDRVRAELGVLLHRVHRGDELLLGRVAALRAHHVVGPAQQIVAVFGGDAEHVADQHHRERRGDVADEVALALLAHRSMIASHLSRIVVLAVAHPARA